MKEEKTKLTVEVVSADYDAVTAGLHHGQLAQLFRKIFTDIKTIVTNPATQDCLVDYVYRNKPLVLGGPTNGEIDQTSDGKN